MGENCSRRAGLTSYETPFSGVLHGIITASVMDITTMGRVMLAENKSFIPTGRMASTQSGWLSKGEGKKKRQRTSVVITFSSLEDENRAIDLGLVWMEKGLAAQC